MAFDMYVGDSHESIGHHEEFLFALAQENEPHYPELIAIWESFYDGPCISAVQAGILVHELIELLDTNGGFTNKPLASSVMRLLSFFSMAYRSCQNIRCCSD